MADARSRQNWSHTAALMALIANCHRDPKKTRPYKPTDFDPHSRRQRSDIVEIDTDTIGLLRNAFTGTSTGDTPHGHDR